MKNKKTSPGQLNIFEQVSYFDKKYNNLKDAMFTAFLDFNLYKKYPAKITAFGSVYDFRSMKRYWDIHGFEDIYIY